MQFEQVVPATCELVFSKDEFSIGDLTFRAKEYSYNKTSDQYTFTDVTINDAVKIHGSSIVENVHGIPVLKTSSGIVLDYGDTIADEGVKEYYVGLSMLVPRNTASYFQLGNFMGIEVEGVVLSFSGDTVSIPSYLKLPWIMGSIMNKEKERFRKRAADLITNPLYVEYSEELHKFSKEANNWADHLEKQKIENPYDLGVSSKQIKVAANVLKLYDIMTFNYKLSPIKVNKIYYGKKDKEIDVSIDVPEYSISKFKIEQLFVEYNSLSNVFDLAFKISWDFKNPEEMKEDVKEKLKDMGLKDDDFADDDRSDENEADSTSLFLNQLTTGLLQEYGDQTRYPDNYGKEIYQSAYGESIDISNTLIREDRRRGLAIEGLGMQMRLCNGKLDKLIVAVDVDIPLPPLPVKLCKISGGVSELTYKDAEGKYIYKDHDFLLELTCDLTDKAGTDLMKITDLGVKIRPFNYFEGGGRMTMLNFEVGRARVFYNNDSRLFKAEVYRAGFAPFGKEGYVGLTLGGRESFEFEGYAAMNFGVPDINTVIPACLRKITIGGGEAGINNHRMAARLKIGSKIEIPKIVDEKRGFRSFWNKIKTVGKAISTVCNKVGETIVSGVGSVLSWMNIEVGIGWDFDKDKFLWGSNASFQEARRITFRGNIRTEEIHVGEDTRKFYVYIEDSSRNEMVDFLIYDPKDSLYNIDKLAQLVFMPESKTTMMIVEAPMTGFWRVEIDQAKFPNAKIQSFFLNNNPSGYFKSPQKVDINQSNVEIEFNDFSDTLDVKLFINNTRDGYMGKEISSFKVLNNATVKLTYSGQGLEPGMYYFYFVVQDNSALPVMQYAPGSLLVTGNPEVPEVTNLKYANTDSSITVSWDKPDVSSISLTVISLTDLVTGRILTIDIPGDSSVSFREVSPGHKYSLSAVNYGSENGYSKKTTLPDFIFNRATGNLAPVWSGAPYNQFRFRECEIARYGLNISDPEGRPVTLKFLENLPKSMLLKNDSIIWGPNIGDKGIYTFHAVISDEINSDTVMLQLMEAPFTSDEVSISFPTKNLYEGDNMFINVEDYETSADSLLISLLNYRTLNDSILDSTQLKAYRVANGKFMASFDLSIKKRFDTNIEIGNGDTIIAIYRKGQEEYVSYAIYDSIPQIIDNKAPDAVNDLKVYPVDKSGNIMLTFTVPKDYYKAYS